MLKHWLRTLITGLVLPMSLLLSGCSSLTHLFFVPDSYYRLTPDQLGLDYKTIKLTTEDKAELINWWIPKQNNAIKTQGTVFFLHGNAENISTHIHSVAWLARHGYNLFLLDYRGYGRSGERPVMPAVMEDIESASTWLLKQPEVEHKPLYLLGQSIGASLAPTWLSQSPTQNCYSALILDAPFASWPGIAANRLQQSWLTWPLLPATLLIPGQWDAERAMPKLNIPVLVFHSRDDQIIPEAQSRKVFESAHPPKQWLSTEGPHIATFGSNNNRTILLRFMEQYSKPIHSLCSLNKNDPQQ